MIRLGIAILTAVVAAAAVPRFGTPRAAPTAIPAPHAPQRPAPTSKQRVRYDRFIVGDYLFAPKVYNEFSPGNTGGGASYAARGGLEFAFFRLPLMLAGEYRSVRYPHTDNGTGRPGDPGFVTVIGGYGQTELPAFIAEDTYVDGRVGVRLAAPRIYLAAGYLHREDDYGYPKQNGYGFGVEKLPDLGRTFSVYGNAYYFPDVSGYFVYPLDRYTCRVGPALVCPAGSLYGTSAKFTDRILKYQIGASFSLTGAKDPFGLFVDGGYRGDSIRDKSLAPGDASQGGAYLGLGLKF